MEQKVLIVGPNVGMGGVERASANYANLLAESGWQVTYLALIPDERFFQLLSAVRFLEGPPYNRQHMAILKTMQHIRQAVQSEQPSVILAFTKFYAALANLALVLTPYRVVVLERSSPLYVWPRQVEWFTRLSFFLKKCAGVISQTTMAAQYHQRYYRSPRLLVLPNPVNPMVLPDPLPSKEKWILLVGRLHDDCKGFDRFMHVLDQLQFPDEEWKVVFAGGSRAEAYYLLRLLRDPAKAERITFLGKVEDLALVYSKSAIFVIPSRSEGFPNALCEAMAAGLPCVSFDFVAGPCDLIEHGVNGFLVEEGNITGMANELEKLMADADLRLRIGQQASQITHRLSYASIRKRLNEFFTREILGVSK